MEKVVEEGSMVHKGDVIVRLSNSNLDLQILNAESELAEKQNLLRNTQVAMQQDKLNNQTEQAQLDMDTQRKLRTFEQNKRLYQEKLISREDFMQSQEDYQLSARKHSLVSQRLKQDSIYRTVQMDQMEDNLQNMRRNVVLVRQRKDKLEVRAAIDGELGLLDVELGQSISPGQKIGQLNDLSNYKVQAQIDEHYIDRVRQGLMAAFTRGDKKYLLQVRKVYPEVREGKFRCDFITSTSNSDSPNRQSSFLAAHSSRPPADSGSSCSTRVATTPTAATSASADRIRNSMRCLKALSQENASSPTDTRHSRTTKYWLLIKGPSINSTFTT